MSEEPSNHRLGQSAFVGRERELRELQAGLDEVCSGRGRFFLVTGEPGIGKSRLADELAAHAASLAMLVLRAGGMEGGGTPAYWAFIQLIRNALDGPSGDTLLELLNTRYAPEVIQDLAQLIPELRHFVAAAHQPSVQPPADHEQAHFRLSESVALAIKALTAIRPLMLVVEDLHDTDRASLQMLRFVVRQLKAAPVLVLATYRDVDVQRSPELPELVGELAHEGTAIPLTGLSRTDTARMVEERAGEPPSARTISYIYQATGGNPLFIDGLVRVLAAEGTLSGTTRLDLATFKIPDGVREAIRRWLALISNRSLLEVAATTGAEFELECLRRVTGIPDQQVLDAMREAAGVGVLTPLARGGYRFSHALIRNALCEQLDSTVRAQLHLKIGQAQEELYRDDIEPHLAELAHHFREAADSQKAVDYSIRAGEAANAVFAYDEAIAHWETALELMPKDRDHRERRADLLERTAELLSLTASRSPRLKYLREALALYKDLGHQEAVVRVELRISDWLVLRDSPPASAWRDLLSMRGFDQTRRNLERGESDRLSSHDRERRTALVRLQLGAAYAGIETGQVERAVTESLRAMEESEQLGEARLWSTASWLFGTGLFLSGRLGEAFALMRKAYDQFDRLDDTVNCALMVQSYAYALMGLRDPTEAIKLLEHELAKSRMAEASQLRAGLFDYLRIAELSAGRPPRGGAPISQTQGDRASLRDWATRELECLLTGDLDQAEVLFGQAAATASETNRGPLACERGCGLAKVRRALGQLSAAEATLQESLAFCLQNGIIVLEPHIRGELAMVYAELGQPEQARPHLERYREILAAGEDWRGMFGHIARAEAGVAAAEGRFEAANEQFGNAANIFHRYQALFEEADTLHYWGRVLMGSGDTEGALVKLDAAIGLYQSHGMGERWVQRIQADKLRAQDSGAKAEAEPAASRAREIGDRHESDRPENSTAEAVFHKMGDYWTLCWAGTKFRLKNRNGLRIIACLLRHPGQQFRAQDLMSISRGGSLVNRNGDNEPAHALTIARDLGDAGPALDETARAQYKRRLEDLREALTAAEQDNDTGGVTKIRHEVEFLEDQIAGSVGLRGRDRKSASHADRARLAVTKSIKSALNLIRVTDAELGRHLALSIKTGHLCAYFPVTPVNWRL